MYLTDSLVYAPKPSAVSSSKYRQNISPYNRSQFNPGEVIQLSIPCGRKGQYMNCLMSYIKFRVINPSAAAGDTIAPDFNIASIFSRYECYHGSSLL